MVDEAKQEQEFEPTPYKHSNRKELDETETVENEDTEKATPQETTSFLSSEKRRHNRNMILKSGMMT